jgi:hypothetical protein
MVAIIYNLILGGIAGICEAFQLMMRTRVDLLLALFPGVPTYLATREVDTSSTYPAAVVWHIAGNTLILLFVVLLLLFESRGYFRNLFALYRDAEK